MKNAKKINDSNDEDQSSNADISGLIKAVGNVNTGDEVLENFDNKNKSNLYLIGFFVLVCILIIYIYIQCTSSKK